MVAGEKRRTMLRELQDHRWQFLRSGGRHDVYECPCGAHRVPVPRHRELPPGVVASIRAAIRKG